MPAIDTDKNFHETDNQQLAPQLTAGAVSTTAVGTISPTTNAGATPTVAIVEASDRRGQFTLSPVTGGGAQAAGAVVVVKFSQPYGDAPRCVLVNIVNETTAGAVACGPTLINGDGFSISSTILTTANVYRVSYLVVP